MLVGFLTDREHSHPHSLGPVDGHILAIEKGADVGVRVTPIFNGHKIFRLRFKFRF